MRVKTETLLLLDDCRQYADCKECPAKAICEDGEKDEYVRTDLIEARELVKEMREGMKLNRDRLAVLGYASETIDAMLEKSKDYA